MGTDEIELTVRRVVAECLHISQEQLTGATSWADLKADSLARIEVMLALEDALGVTIADEDAGRLWTLADVVAYLDPRAQGASPNASP